MWNRRKFIATSLWTPCALAYAQQKSKRLRVAQVGLAHSHAKGKLYAVRDMSDVFDLVGVVESDPTLRRKVSGVPFISTEQIEESNEIDIVVIETHVNHIARLGKKFASKGFHLHLDKPAGTNLKDLEDLFAIAKKQKRLVQLGYVLRYNPVFQFMHKAVNENWFGEILEIDATMGKLASPSLRDEFMQFKGGGFFELAGNILDPVISLLGKPDRVIGVNKQTQIESGDRLPDNQLGVLEYKNAIVTLRCNHMDPFGFAKRSFKIFGTQGGMEVSPLESGTFKLFLKKDNESFAKGIHEVKLPNSGRDYQRDFSDLAKCVLGQNEFQWSPEHDLIVQQTLLDISQMGVRN